MISNYKVFCPIFGLVIWALARVFIWSFRDELFGSIGAGGVWIAYLATAMMMSILTLILIRRYRLGIWQRLQAAMLIVLPGMLLDVVVVGQLTTWCPEVDVAHVPIFASLMLWSYVVILATALVSRLWTDGV